MAYVNNLENIEIVSISMTVCYRRSSTTLLFVQVYTHLCAMLLCLSLTPIHSGRVSQLRAHHWGLVETLHEIQQRNI